MNTQANTRATNSVRQVAGISGVVAVAALIANLAFTTDGPRPDKPAATEAARALAQAGELRASALLIVVMAIAMGTMLMMLADLASTTTPGRRASAGLLRGVAVAATAVWLVSASALAAVPQVAESKLSDDFVIALGDLHTTLFFADAALVGAGFVLAGWTLLGILPRWSTWLAILVGVCGMISSVTMAIHDFDLGHGLPVAFVVPYFFGLPLWMLSTSVVLLTASERPVRSPAPVGG
jgi:hypothetical protein